MAPALLFASLPFSPSSRPLATHTRAAPAQAALFGPGERTQARRTIDSTRRSLLLNGTRSIAAWHVDPLDARGLETYSGGVTSRVWYTPPTEWNDLLFALNHEASETLHDLSQTPPPSRACAAALQTSRSRLAGDPARAAPPRADHRGDGRRRTAQADRLYLQVARPVLRRVRHGAPSNRTGF